MRKVRGMNSIDPRPNSFSTPASAISSSGAAWFDAHVVDGAINGAATTARETAGVARRGQSGYVRAYAGIIGVGVAVVLAFLVVFRGIL